MSDWQRELEWNAIAYGVLAGLALVGLAALWIFVPALRRRWLPLPRLRPGAWGGYEVFLTFCILQGFPLLIIGALLYLGVFTPLFGPAPELDPPTRELNLYIERCQSVASPLILTVTLGMIMLVLFARTETRPHHYGLSWGRWPANLGVGLAAFVAATPLVIGSFWLITRVIPNQAHALTELGRANLEDWEWALIAFQATVAAPLLEEITFRGIVQGWLRRATLRGHVSIGMATLFVGIFYIAPGADASWLEYLSPLVFSAVLVGGYAYLLRRVARQFALTEAELLAWQVEPMAPLLEPGENATEEEAREKRQQARETDERRRKQWDEANADIALLGSAMLFAVVHGRFWPSPLPLLLLGLLLGWLAKRTQSLIAPIVLHSLFNLVAFIALYGTVMSAPPLNGNAATTATRPSVFGSTISSVPASQLPLRK